MPDGARLLPGWPRALREDLAAAYCGLSPSAFQRAVAPKVPAIRPSPGCVAWLRDDLDAYLDDCRTAGQPAREEAPDDAELRALAARLAAPPPSARGRKAKAGR